MTIAVLATILAAIASISASIAAIFSYVNHGKVSEVRQIVNGRLAETLSMLRDSAEALAASELKRHDDNQV